MSGCGLNIARHAEWTLNYLITVYFLFLKIRENLIQEKLPNNINIVGKLDPAESFKVADREKKILAKKISSTVFAEIYPSH